MQTKGNTRIKINMQTYQNVELRYSLIFVIKKNKPSWYFLAMNLMFHEIAIKSMNISCSVFNWAGISIGQTSFP